MLCAHMECIFLYKYRIMKPVHSIRGEDSAGGLALMAWQEEGALALRDGLEIVKSLTL